MRTTRSRGQPAVRKPLDDDMPSGRLLSTMAPSRATLTPPCSTVRPSTNDPGIPSTTEPEPCGTPARAGAKAGARGGAALVPAPAPPAATGPPPPHPQVPDGDRAGPDQGEQPGPPHLRRLQGLVDQLERHRADQQAGAQ